MVIERFLIEFPRNSAKIDRLNIIPPYNSKPIPIVTPSTYSSSDSKRGGFDRIDTSIRPEGVGMYGDFGRYTFQSALNRFKNVDIENLYHYAMQYIRDELGYSDELFTEYDISCGHPLDRGRNHTIERIGKKYQWIAFYNILARVSDFHKLKGWGNSSDEEYKGAWEPYVRDFDPTLNCHFMLPLESLPEFNIEYNENFIEDIEVDNQQINEWILHKTSLFDMPLIYKDNDGIEWVLLYQHKEIKNQKDEVSDSFSWFCEGHQRMWRIVKAYFVKNSEFDSLKSNFEDREMFKKGIQAEVPSLYQVYNREFPWSPGVKEFVEDFWFNYNVETDEEEIKRRGEEIELVEKEEYVTVKVKKTLAKLLPAHIHFCWEEEHDASKKETISFDIPCPELLDKLHLVQKKYDGYFFSQDGDLVAFDGELTDTINGLIIRKDYLDQFLQENDLGIFWDFVGEKQYFTESPREQYYSRWKGFFWMVNSEILSDIDLDEQKLGSIDF